MQQICHINFTHIITISTILDPGLGLLYEDFFSISMNMKKSFALT